MKGAYYNEHDPFAAAWLRSLIFYGCIAPGDVDERSIEDVCADDLRGYVQHHFFAGIGVWSAALREAGWPDDRPVWTGSCPCQPFSAAGKGEGFADERHLWPAWFWLIEQCRPDVVLGEQVASKPGLAWFDLVSSDLEGADYTCGAVDLCAAGLGAPHIRQRNYWMAHHHRCRSSAGRRDPGQVRDLSEAQREPEHGAAVPGRSGSLVGLDNVVGRPAGGDGHGSDDRIVLNSAKQHGDVADALPAGRPERRPIAGIGSTPSSSSIGRTVVDASGQQERLPGCAREPGEAGPGGRLLYTSSARLDGQGEGPEETWDETRLRGLKSRCAIDDRPLALPDGGDACAEGLQRGREHGQQQEDGVSSQLAHHHHHQRCDRDGAQPEQGWRGVASDDSELGHHHHQGLPQRPFETVEPGTLRIEGSTLGASGLVRGRWAGADWIFCRDGKWRPVESGTFPLAYGAPRRVGRLRGYGNAIVLPVAAAFIEEVLTLIA